MMYIYVISLYSGGRLLSIFGRFEKFRLGSIGRWRWCWCLFGSIGLGSGIVLLVCTGSNFVCIIGRSVHCCCHLNSSTRYNFLDTSDKTLQLQVHHFYHNTPKDTLPDSPPIVHTHTHPNTPDITIAIHKMHKVDNIADRDHSNRTILEDIGLYRRMFECLGCMVLDTLGRLVECLWSWVIGILNNIMDSLYKFWSSY